MTSSAAFCVPNVVVSLPVLLFAFGCAGKDGVLTEHTSDFAATTQGSTTGSTGDPSVTGSGTITDGEPTENEPSLAEQAAAAACLAHANATPIKIPTQESGGIFVLGTLPALFSADSTNASPVWDGYWCHTFGGAEPNQSPYWPVENSWVEDDNQIHVYLVTKGIDDIVYFGTGESQANVPGEPKTAAVHHEMSSVCPALPAVWSPEPAGVAGSQNNARIICMRHSETVAEIAWVRVP